MGQADVIVIGGGVMGASVAFNLARRRVGRVLLLERGAIASGQTGRSSAVIRMHYAVEPLVKLAVYSLHVFQNFAEIVGGESGFTPCGYVALSGASDLEAFEHNVALQRQGGASTSRIDPGDLRDLMPEMFVDDVLAAAYEPESGYADPVLTTQAFAQAAADLSVELRPNTPVRALRYDGSGVSAVETEAESFTTRCVVACPGVWWRSLLEPLGLHLPIEPVREEMAVFARPAQFAPHLVVHDVDQAIYLRPEGRDLTLVGNTDRRREQHVVDPDSYQEGASEETVSLMASKFIHRFPVMAQGVARPGYAGLYDVTPDLCPILEESAIGGLFVAAGFSGQGFKLAPAIGAFMAELVTDRATTSLGVPADFFSSQRFSEHRPIQGSHRYRKDVLPATRA